jgi:hypothetical protein
MTASWEVIDLIVLDVVFVLWFLWGWKGGPRG